MKIAVIGTGNMGQALIGGFIAKKSHLPEEIFIYDYDGEKSLKYAEQTGCVFCSRLKDAVGFVDAVLLAVKPQTIESVVLQIRDLIKKDTIVISIAAGIKTDKIRKYLGNPDTGIVRVMPNTPALIGEGASAVCFDNVTDRFKKYVNELFSTCGLVLEVDEKKMDAVTGLSGSGPAYVMVFIEALADAGVRMGLTREEALCLACATVKGSAALVLETKIHPAQLKDNVCSPGGTTIEALYELEKGGFRSSVINAVTASARRSKELSKDS